MTVPADSHNRGRISESAAKGCVAASCVALMALGFVSLAWPLESPLSSARSQSTGFSFPGNPVPAVFGARPLRGVDGRAMPFRRGMGTSDLASQGGLCRIDGLRHGGITGIGARARPSDPTAVDDPRDSTGGVPVRGDLYGQCGIRAICVVISHDRFP